MIILLNELIVGLGIGTLIFIFIGILTAIKLRSFESESTRKILNVVATGIALYSALVIVDVLNYLDILGVKPLAGYLPMMNNISALIIAPLFAAMILAAVLILRDA